MPALLSSTLKTRLTERLATHDVTVSLSSTPNLMVSLGRIGSLHIIAHSAKVGEVYVEDLAAEGNGVRMDMQALLSDGTIRLESAESLSLMGTITELNLKELISRKVERLEDVQVKITSQEILVTAGIKVFGRMADVEMTGAVLEDDGALYFRMARLNVKNAFPGKLSLDNFFGDIQIVKPDKLPLGARFENVEMQEGKVVITAGRQVAE